jgi:hypothetical protein
LNDESGSGRVARHEALRRAWLRRDSGLRRLNAISRIRAYSRECGGVCDRIL